MVLIGMLHHRKNPTKVQKSYAYAAVCMAEGAELVYFSPKKVDFSTSTINGFMYKNGKWERVKTRFPDVIYNAGTPVKLNKSQDIINKLKAKIPFTTHSIGNKLQVYHRLLKDGDFIQHLIPTEFLNSKDDFIWFMKNYSKVIIKPIDGHKGEGVIYIEYKKDLFKIKQNEETSVVTYDEVLDFIETKLSTDHFLIQPYIQSKTKNNQAYDFRLHTQKNGEGNWVITAIYARIGKKGSVVTNINQGGATNYATPFLKEEFGDEHQKMKENLEDFCLRLSKKMDELQKKYFNEELDELGFDVGIDEYQNIWLYEINWRPGCPPAFYLELDVVKNMIKYAIYLAKKNQ